MFRVMFLALFLLAQGTVSAAPATILVMGDSLSAGYGIRQDEAWPVLLARRLQEQKLDYNVANLSISGETSSGGRSRFEQALKQHRPAIVILVLGANDGLRGLPAEVMRDNLAAMIAASRKADARVLLVGMRLPPNYGADYTQKFQRVFADLARAYKLPLAPFLMAGFAGQREMFQADGIHPVAAAQPLMLDNIWPKLRPLLKQK